MPQIPYNEPRKAALINNTVSGTTSKTLGTPNTDAKLRSLNVSLPSDATLATAGKTTLTVSLNGVAVFVDSVYVPATAPDSAGLVYDRKIDFGGAAFPAGTGKLTAKLSTALATSAFNVNGYFTA